MQAMQLTPQPTDTRMRVLDLKVTSASGEMRLQLPWDLTAFDLEPVLVSRLALDDRRQVAAYAPTAGETVDLLEVPLGQALRNAENPHGAETLVIEVAHEEESHEFTVSCADVGEPQPHLAYPRGIDDEARRLVDAYRSVEDSDWFCDGSSTLSCCEAAREQPQHQNWVGF